MSISPKVSVIVAIYNIENHLPACLDSITLQTLKDFELILVNDGSKDTSGKICEVYAANHPNTTVIHKENGGLSTARNAGLELANGEYLYFIDGDDLLHPETLKENYSILEKDPADILIFGHTKEVIINGSLSKVSRVPEPIVLDSKQSFKTQLVSIFQNGNGFAVWEMMIKASFVKEHGLRFPNFKRGSDMAFLFETYPKAKKLLTNPKPYYRYQIFQSQGKFSPNILPDHVKFYERFLMMYKDWMELPQNRKYGLSLFLLWFAHVIPTNFVNYEGFEFSEKKKQLKGLLEHPKVVEWKKLFSIWDCITTPIPAALLLIMKVNSPLLLYYTTKIKNLIRKNVPGL